MGEGGKGVREEPGKPGPLPVLRIRDVYPGSNFFPSRILTVSIPDPGSASKNFILLSILIPKNQKNGF
jgi:hypothetical protein